MVILCASCGVERTVLCSLVTQWLMCHSMFAFVLVIRTASRLIPYKPLVDQAIALSPHKPSKVVVFQRSMLRSSLEPGE